MSAYPLAVVVTIAANVPIVTNKIISDFHCLLLALFEIAEVYEACILFAILEPCCWIEDVVFNFDSFVGVVVDMAES